MTATYVIGLKFKKKHLEIFLEDTRKLLSFHLVVVYPGLDGDCWILGGWNSI